MGGLRRLKPEIVPTDKRQEYTCTTLGCPDEAVVILPLNVNSQRTFSQTRGISGVLEVTERADYYGRGMEIRLCRKCVRTLATALPPGIRLTGAVLRYPEVDPQVCAPDEIPGTPEYDKSHS